MQNDTKLYGNNEDRAKYIKQLNINNKNYESKWFNQFLLQFSCGFSCFQLQHSVGVIFFILTLLSLNNVAFTIYTDRKQQIVGTFFNCLDCCPSTKYLCAKVNDPELGGTTQLFFVKLQGTRLPIKRKCLALCLMAFPFVLSRRSTSPLKSFVMQSIMPTPSMNQTLLLPVCGCYLHISGTITSVTLYIEISTTKIRDLIDVRWCHFFYSNKTVL